MKSGKRIIALALMLVMIINCSNLGAFRVLAHSSVLNVEYDACINIGSHAKTKKEYKSVF